MARPKLEINPLTVEKLARIGCKNTEIAAFLDCSVDTIEKRFSGELRKGRENMKTSLRRWQLKAAKAGNVAMLIWLGKQYLEQSDKIEQTVATEYKGTVIYESSLSSLNEKNNPPPQLVSTPQGTDPGAQLDEEI